MVVDTEKAIAWMGLKKGRVSYSMDCRNGPDSYDCSSAICSALIYAGASNPGWLLNTEYMHDWLVQNGFELIADNEDWDSQRADIAIWGFRGQSAGAGGHVVMFIDADNIIHCNYANNNITIDNYNQTAAASGWMYSYVYRYTGAKAQPATNKSIDELVQEVLSGKHGSGEQRKISLGTNYDAVQAKVNEMLKQPQVAEQSPAVKQDGDLLFNGAVLKKTVLDKILAKCKEHDILPSYAITVLHFEGLWGQSAVGRTDNNWGGMTWTGQGNRPSGITVTQGTERPAVEGGHYMHYASVDDFLTDWFYLLRADGSYRVSGAKTFSEAVKGMFKVGGATYDYAASGFDSYIVGMAGRLKAIEQENGSLAKYDQQTDIDVGQSDKIDVVIDSLEININGVTYTATKKPI
ncbi:TPA: peptidoglycan amidohydrolase family protein [Streptococcus pyogenes]|uniref:peptidoglycan amidohydrolase family protein n=2 Tax=Streptococcus pyogenes TaxID=1314 RepID=UPI00022CAF2E|nr:peptidoglycan amidohydrolase family protein [Streptococcus pyogenes]ESU91013.1 bacteriophage peptidoglycan hydrolase [Streptococcus pyogenes GA03455]QBX28286.1 lysin [Streptococcus phage Javan448]QBX28433.1 lysin [Streptococcus phage Javan452]HER4532976.1 glucosaminidase domain-containing protein [Streptococcus pyogenes NGAS751]HER4676385.1 glucosaminidase domain-containing protein [Streptococcus pyogenes NGAS346]HER4711109.1 glucosaminidase domain-containing protein [Streptococcus pyogene